MKVSDLIETDEWTNNSVTLKYLYKKQASACHRFKILAKNFEDINTETWGDLPMNLDNCNSSSWFFDKLHKKILSLRQSAVILHKPFDAMVRAKEAFEDADGRYPKVQP